MIYQGLKLVGSFLLQLFFRKIEVQGAPLVKGKPLLIVANHPNFLFDPALIGFVYSQPLWFLAKSTLFSGPVVSFVCRALHMVPVYRRQDDPADMGKNADTFAFAEKCLRAGNAIALFPEGVSLGERTLAPIKTGAARIALQTEQASGCGLQIQPVGITYADLREFQTSVTVVAGEPISVSEFMEQFAIDSRQAVTALTTRIDQALRSVTVEVDSGDSLALVEMIGKLYSSRGFNGDDRTLLSEIATRVETAREQSDPNGEIMLLKLRWYISLANALGLDPSRPLNSRMSIFLLLACPFVLIGILFHLIPYRLVGVVVEKITGGAVETATMKLFVGLALFGVWYLVTGLILISLIGTANGLCIALVFLAATGYFALRWAHDVRALIGGWLLPGSARARQRLHRLSDELFSRCEEYRTRG